MAFIDWRKYSSGPGAAKVLARCRQATGKLPLWNNRAMSEATPSLRSRRLLLGIAALLAVPLATRFLALGRRDLTAGWGDLAGIAADLGVGAVAAALIAALPARWLRTAAGTLWGLAHWAQLEHVTVLGGPLSLRYAGYLRDPEFLFGSALEPTTLVPGLGLVLLGTLAGFLLPRARRRLLVPLAAAGLVLSTVVLLLPGPHSWRDGHFVLSELARLGRSVAAPAGAETPAAQTAHMDLSGERLVPVLPDRPNVLLLVMEGVSGTYLPRLGLTGGEDVGLSLPTLDGLVDRSVAVRTLFSHQRQTNRGLWALLCGRLPDLGSGEAKLTRLARSGEHLPCLPVAFEHAGYRTIFQQAAPLSFMVKDRAMAAVGFQQVGGDESLERAYRRTPWGVDDRAFLEQAAELAAGLQEKRRQGGPPWFLTLLTVGTHHPYTVPQGEPTLANAMHTLDRAVGQFVDQLGAAGLLDDTLLVITNDESAGALEGDEWTQALSQNLGLLLLRYPDERSLLLETPAAQRDVAATILDAVGAAPGASDAGAHAGAEATVLGGRSALRRHPPRPLFFGNTYLDRTYGFFPPGRLLVCDGSGQSCEERPFDPHDPFHPGPAAAPEAALATTLARTVAAARSSPAEPSRRWTLPLHAQTVWKVPHEVGGHRLFMGQSIAIPAHTALDFDLDLEIEGTSGWAHLRTDLVHQVPEQRAGGSGPRAKPSRTAPLWVSELPVVAPGDRIRISLHLVTAEPLTGFDARGYFNVLIPGDLSVRVRRAEISAAPAPEGTKPGVQVRKLEVDRSQTPPTLRAGMADQVAAGTLSDELTPTADGSFEAVVAPTTEGPEDLVGPQIYVPRGSRVHLEATVEAVSGGESGAGAGPAATASARLALASPRYGIVLGQTAPRPLSPGQPIHLTLDLPLQATLNEVGPVLFVQTDRQVRLSIRSLRLEADLP